MSTVDYDIFKYLQYFSAHCSGSTVEDEFHFLMNSTKYEMKRQKNV